MSFAAHRAVQMTLIQTTMDQRTTFNNEQNPKRLVRYESNRHENM